MSRTLPLKKKSKTTFRRRNRLQWDCQTNMLYNTFVKKILEIIPEEKQRDFSHEKRLQRRWSCPTTI